MRLTPSLTLNNVTYKFPSADRALFTNLSLTLDCEKVGLLGRNGVGKTTLLQLINGELKANGGSVRVTQSMVTVKQEQNCTQTKNVADLLGITKKLNALTRIEKGLLHSEDFELLQNDWDFQDRALSLLTDLGLTNIDLQREISSLSGGEQTRIALANAFFNPYDFVILDEPTNNLDKQARQALYEQINQFNGCLLVVSHDRTLLRLMDRIAELKTTGLFLYGGNFDYYQTEKNTQESAMLHQLDASLKILEKSKESIQRRRQQFQKNVSKGLRTKKAMIKAKGCADKIMLNSKKGRSEKTNRRIRIQADRKLSAINSKISDVKKNIEIQDEFVVCLEEAYIPTTKIVLNIENLCFGYTAERIVFDHFNLTIMGPERVAIIGDNGSGKSTLFKLISGHIQSSLLKSGKIFIGVERINYFDQHASSLNPELTVLENFRAINPDISEAKAWTILAQFKFRKKAALKQVKNLSGGEKLRALFATVLMSTQPPQLLIIDEPTNHLDFESLEVIEEAIRNYRGALLVVSHDQDFLGNVGVQRSVSLSQNT